MTSNNLIKSLLNIEYPKLLHASEDVIFQDAINKRTEFSNFYNSSKKNKLSFNKEINSLLVKNLKNTKNSINVIGGSRSWNNLINNNYKAKLKDNNITLSNLEKTSIIPGNYDIFCICNNSKSVNTIMNKMCKVFDDIITFTQEQKIEVKYVRNYEQGDEKLFIEKGKNKGVIKCLLNNYYSEQGCVFAPCKAMHLEIIGGKYNEKVLIYFELILIENPKIIHYVIDNIIDYNPNNNLNYLNLKGLYLFSELIISRRRDKEFDVDTYRKNLLNKLIEIDPNFNKINLYNKIMQIYLYMFKDRTNYNFMKIILTKNFVFLSDKHIIDDYSSYLTENFRKYINSFIINTNLLLLSENNCKIFVTGGDAYRRYIPDIITQTNDIDLKLVYTDKNDYNKLLNIIIKQMSEFIYILYSHKPINYIKSYKINNLISVEFIPKYAGGQFRLRYVESENFTLLSIDYRYRLKININNNSIIVNEEFALLDIVLYHNDVLPNTTPDDQIPIASPHYLINDLRTIYDKISHDLRSRFPKNSKDKQRFKNLIEYIKKYQLNSAPRLLKRKYDDDDIEFDSIRNIKTHKSNNETIYVNKVKKFLEECDNHDYHDYDELDNIEGNNLNIHFNNNFYNKLSNSDITNEYADTFIQKIIKNNQLDEEDKVYKIKMNVDDIKIIASKYVNFNEDELSDLSDLSDLFSKVTLIESDTDDRMIPENHSPKNNSPKNNIINANEENIDVIDKMFYNLNL